MYLVTTVVWKGKKSLSRTKAFHGGVQEVCSGSYYSGQAHENCEIESEC